MTVAAHIIRKPIDPDCLLDGELHPSIRARLERVRELPVKGVANLRGVERTGDGVFAQWDFVPGQTLEAFAITATEAEVARVLREAELILAAMHAAGIVHGAVHERNILITDAGEVKLTHVSPLLFDDEQADADAMEDIRASYAWEQPATREPPAREPERGFRLRVIAAAAVIAIAGVAMAATIGWYVRRANVDPYAPVSNEQVPIANQ